MLWTPSGPRASKLERCDEQPLIKKRNAARAWWILWWIREMRERFGISVLIVDQNVRRLMGIVDRVAILKAGRKVFDGPPASITNDDQLWQLS